MKPEPPVPPPRHVPLAAALVAAAVGLAYANSLGGPFLFDDTLSIVENPTLRRLFAWEIFRPPAGQGITVEGRPLLNASFALNYALSGLAVRGYHLLNVAIHLGAALALLGTLHRTLRLPRVSPGLRAHALPLATLSALIWALHPVQTESVTYVVQRAESLMGAWVFTTLYGFVRGAAPGGDPRWFGLAFAAAVGGALSKEVAAVAPVLVLLYDRTLLAGSFAAAWRARRGVHLALMGTWLINALLILGAGSRGGTVGFGSNVAWSDYLLTQFEALAHYVRLTVWPHPLVFDHGTVWVRSAVGILPAIGLAGLVIGGTLVALRRWPVAGLLGALFLGPLAPTSLVPGNRQTMAEHRLYLPLAAVAIAGGVGGFLLLRRRPAAVRIGVAGLVVGALGALTVRRNHDYRSELALYRDTVAKRPENAFARYNLGKCLAESGAPAAAVAEYRAAIQLRPGMMIAHYNLGNALATLGETAAAEAAFRAALRLEPRHARSQHALGNLLIARGQRAEALAAFTAAVAAAPEFTDARLNRGGVLLDLGRLDEARREFEAVLRREPDSADAHLNLGHVHLLAQRATEARREYEIALRLAPGFAPARAALERLPPP